MYKDQRSARVNTHLPTIFSTHPQTFTLLFKYLTGQGAIQEINTSKLLKGVDLVVENELKSTNVTVF